VIVQRFALLGSIAFAMLLAACGRQGPRAVPLEMKQMGFSPDTVHAKVGDTLVVTNRDMVPHTITARDSAWDSGSIAPDSTARVVITKTGAFFCVFHPTMTGTIAD